MSDALLPQQERAALMAQCRTEGLARLQEIDPVDMTAMPAHFLKVGTGWSTRCMDTDGPARLAQWRSIVDNNQGDVAGGGGADQIGRRFGSPAGERTLHRSTLGVSAGDDSLPSAACKKTPLSFTASVETKQLPVQGQLFDPATIGQRP